MQGHALKGKKITIEKKISNHIYAFSVANIIMQGHTLRATEINLENLGPYI